MSAQPPERRLEAAIYGAALFSNSLGYMIMVVMPLWLIHIGVSPLMLGIILGARHFLVMLYSIHGGAMMDRMDTRRIMLAFAWVGIIAPFLFPMFPVPWAIILIQMVAGYCTAIGWIGAQAMIGQALKGSALHSGRMSACVRLGALIGPPLAGGAWDLGGAWAAFGVLALWGLGQFTASYFLPATPKSAAVAGPLFRARDVLPRPGDYLAALSLLAIPTIAIAMGVAILRISGFSIQASFYTVWLDSQGYSGILIGVLMAGYSLCGGGMSLLVGRMVRLVPPMVLLLFMSAVSILMITITPLLGLFWLLLVAACLNGAAYGTCQPLLISITSQASPEGDQGKAVGLRTTANRIAATFVPVLVGGIVQVVGIENGFFITGSAILAALLIVALLAHRYETLTPRIARHKPEADKPPAA